jgi:hypothetical protein
LYHCLEGESKQFSDYDPALQAAKRDGDEDSNSLMLDYDMP